MDFCLNPWRTSQHAARALALLLMLSAWCRADDAAVGPRGIWWWADRQHPWGTEQVLGNAAKETEVVRLLREWKVGVVYGSFGGSRRADPALLRAWNARLHAAGVSSQLLLSENTWIFPEHRAKLLQGNLRKELLDFNAACATPGERFDGLHLDIEPHGLPGWKTMTPERRKETLFLLRDTFREVRTLLDANGAARLPVYADLPVWFDQPAGPVGWKDAAERDAWFADLGKSLAGISLMAYERDTAAKIENGVRWELDHFQGEVRIGLEASVGPGKTWKNAAALTGMVETQEALGTPPRRVDLHAFTQYLDAVKPAGK